MRLQRYHITAEYANLFVFSFSARKKGGCALVQIDFDQNDLDQNDHNLERSTSLARASSLNFVTM